MKTITLISTLIFSIASVSGYSQANTNNSPESKAKKKFKITDASVAVGGMMQNSPINSIANFKTLNPQSVLLNTDFSTYNSSTGEASIMGQAFIANVALTKIKSDNPEKKAVGQLRLGLSYQGTTISNSLSKTDRMPYDTLTSSQTGQTVVLDSVKRYNYNMNYTTQEVRLDVSYIYRTNPSARWSVYGGAGIEVGKSIISYSTIFYSEGTSTQGMMNNSNYSSSTSGKNKIEERFINKSGFGYAAYMPLGLDFRIGQKREFFKQLHLFVEMRPYINYMNIPEIGSFGGLGMKTLSGIRITI